MKFSIILNVVLFLALLFLYQCKSQIEADNDSLSNVINYKTDSIKITRDKLNRSVATRQALEANVEHLKQSKDTEIKALLKEVSKLKNLHSITKTTIATTGTIKGKLEPKEGIYKDRVIIGSRMYTYSDKWLTLAQVIKQDSIFTTYTVTESLILGWEWKRKNVFKPYQLVVTATSENPNSTVKDLQAITIKEKKKKWFETTGFKIFIGACVGYVGSKAL